MKFPEHITLSFLLAQFGVQQEYGPTGTVLMILAGNLPDVDTLTLFVSRHWYRKYHRIVGHGLPVTLAGPPLLALLGSHVFDAGPFLLLWRWLQAALLVHLFTDIAFYNWPVQLLWPFSSAGWAFGWLTWNDLIPTLILYAGTILVVIWPAQGAFIAGITLVGFTLYLCWRAARPRSRSGWAGWITGDWAPEAPRIWRMLTGDFLT